MKHFIHLITFVLLVMTVCPRMARAQEKQEPSTLHELQQHFVDLRFGMFLHFNMPTFSTEDWPDPFAPASDFSPMKLDCSQWAKAAKSAHMKFGCLTTKHHSGFCIWDTKTTDYNVMNSPLKRDVVKEYVEAFRKEGLEVMLYYSILDIHHDLRKGMVTPQHIAMVKEQLTELLTGYGPITALIIDGWDAPWSRISYDEVPFEEIYLLIKSLQPNCLVMDHNAAKYPAEALFYTDIKTYEQRAGQKVNTEANKLPALSNQTLQRTWFWKEDMPTGELKSVDEIVNEDLVPMGAAHCTFMLNVAPNRDGLLDANAVERLAEIGKVWKNDGRISNLPESPAPILSSNIAKNKPARGSWSYDMQIYDFANDDDFETYWQSCYAVKEPWLSIELGREKPINMIVLTEKEAGCLQKYRIEYRLHNQWITVFDGVALSGSRVKIHRFPTVWADAVRLTVEKSNGDAAISELGVYQERSL